MQSYINTLQSLNKKKKKEKKEQMDAIRWTVT